MDVQMPGVDGVDATTLIREAERSNNRKAVPIVALTAFAANSDRRRCIEAGMDDFMTKPLMRDSLIDTLSRWLGEEGGDFRNDEESPRDNPAVSGGPLDDARFSALGRSMRSMPGGLRSVLESYLESLSRLPVRIRTALQDNDAQELARAAHSLKSNSAAAGALDLSGLCADLEVAARDGGSAVSERHLLAIENETHRVRTAVEAKLGDIPKVD